MSIVWNCVSGGTCSVAMALLHPKNPCLVVNTGGNLPEAWRQIHELQKRRHKIIVISSFIQGYSTYYDYIKTEELYPFYRSCNHKAKRLHMDRFFGAIAPVTVNIGITEEEADRADEFKSTWKIRYQFPVIEYTREQLEKILRGHDMKPLETRTGCFFCGKQPKSSWEWLKENHPEKYQECLDMKWRIEK